MFNLKIYALMPLLRCKFQNREPLLAVCHVFSWTHRCTPRYHIFWLQTTVFYLIFQVLNFHSSIPYYPFGLFTILLSFAMAPTNGLVTLCMAFLCLASVQARHLTDCVSSASSNASSESTSAVAKATSDAFAQCTVCPCTSSASTAAEVRTRIATLQNSVMAARTAGHLLTHSFFFPRAFFTSN